jgi:peptide/nickel transport system substrate-binding protein
LEINVLKIVRASFIKEVFTGFLVAAALAVLGCGTSSTPASPAGTTASVPASPTASTPSAIATLAAPTATKESTLRVVLHYPPLPPPSDPGKGGGFHLIQIGVAETLFKLGHKDLKLEPWLATGAKILDEKTWEVTIRPGVKFHDGALMDAAAVKASLDRAIANSAAARGLLDIASIEIKDPITLTITNNKLSPILPNLLTHPTTAIVNAAAAAAMGDAFTQNPVLTGPFKVQKFQQDREIVVVRHPEYWGPKPKVDRVIFSYLQEGNSRVLALQSGDVDMAFLIGPESVSTVNNTPGLAIVPGGRVSLSLLFLNHRREPWKDVRARQAVSLAIDREGQVKAIAQGQADSATTLFPTAMLNCQGLRGHTYDPARARELLIQAGYQDKDGDGYVEKDGQTLAMTLLTTRQRSDSVPTVEAIQANLKNIGIKVNIGLVEQIVPGMQQSEWDAASTGNNVATTGDPYGTLTQFFTTGASGNYGAYANPQFDEMMRQLAITTDRPAREQLSCKAQQTVLDEVALVPLRFPSWDYGISNKVIDFDPHFFNMYFMDSTIGKR